jgi:hypothetical protein
VQGSLAGRAGPRGQTPEVALSNKSQRVLLEERDAGDYAAVAGWFANLTPAELETFCNLSDRVLARLAND